LRPDAPGVVAWDYDWRTSKPRDLGLDPGPWLFGWRIPMTLSRRAILLGLLSAPHTASEAAAAPGRQAGPDPSLYIPKAHIVEDRTFLHDFMEEYSFATVVTPAPTLRITHIPTVLDRARGRYGTIMGHISAQNPQKIAFDGSHAAVLVFRGPHGYISPSWYAKQDSVVPTWNFGVVHVSGRPRAITDKGKTYELLATLIRRNERGLGSTTYDFSAQPKDYVDRMIQGISPFEMEIEAIEGKFKLGQERSEGDRSGILTHMKGGGYRERSLEQFTSAFYQRTPR
jgi:transcriptional regulator